MNSHPPIIFILTLSIGIQAAAAIMAFRLIGITGRRAAWSFIAAALTLMAVRRVVPLYRLMSGDVSISPDPLNEIIGLALSAAMAAGIAFIAPLFIERKQREEALAERVMLAELSVDIGLAMAKQDDLRIILDACAEALVRLFSAAASEQNAQLPTLCAAAETLLAPRQIVVVGRPAAADTEALLAAARQAAPAGAVLTAVAPGAALPAAHPAAGKGLRDGRATAYVCAGAACGLPITDAGALRDQLATL